MKRSAKKNNLFALLFILSVNTVFSQTTLPLNYSPDGSINSIIAKGDTLIVGGNFNHVGKYTGGGALLSPNTDNPDLLFPKINGSIKSSSSDGNGGFYIVGSFFKESENSNNTHYRIEHILANNTFEANFSLTLSSPYINHILYHNGVLYIGSDVPYTIDGQAVDKLAAINVTTKAIQSWIPALTVTVGNTAINKIFAKGHTLYIIGNFSAVGGIAREDAAAIQIGTGTVRAWNPRPNWVNYTTYNDLVFYNDKIVIGGSFDNAQLPSYTQYNCAVIDTVSGQSVNFLFGNNRIPLYYVAFVQRLQIKDNTLFVYTSGTFDTRVTAINLITSGLLWMKYFNQIAGPKDMVVIDSSLFLMGDSFEKVYITNETNSEVNFERDIVGGAKLDIATGNLQNWFPEPTGRNPSILIRTMAVNGNNLFIGGEFSHINSVKRLGLYAISTSTETILPLKLEDNIYDANIRAMKLTNGLLIIGGGFTNTNFVQSSLQMYNVTTNAKVPWNPPFLGSLVISIEANSNHVFVGGNIGESTGGAGRQHLFAINVTTGALESWAPNPNLQVNSLLLANNQLYVGGDFTTITSQNRNRVASFDVSNLTLTNWNPNANGSVYSIHPRSGTIWLGGAFSNVGVATRNLLAGVAPSNGANNINSTTNFQGSPVINLNSKGCKLFIGGFFQANNTSICNSLSIFDLNTNALIPTNNFCMTLDSQSPSLIRNTALIGNDLYFAGTFTKINNDTKNTNIGRIRFPTNYFTPCEIANCGNEINLTSTADDLSTGTYTQKTNLNISASNKIVGNAKVTLKSNSSILLLPNTKGFTAKPISGGSFKAEISPCN